MKKFLAIFKGSSSSAKRAQWDAMDTAKRDELSKAGVAAWKKWVTENQASIVEHGSPLGRTKSINASGISDIRNSDAAFVVVQAESHEAAAKLFLNHPHFAIFPGDSVEVMECLPMPG